MRRLTQQLPSPARLNEPALNPALEEKTRAVRLRVHRRAGSRAQHFCGLPNQFKHLVTATWGLASSAHPRMVPTFLIAV